MRLSIIVPVFKVEKHIAKCLESCLKQDIPLLDYEIIVINDGSPDGSRNIAVEFAKQYENIRIIDRENGGISAARNTGLRAAKGKYIWFVDSDDWIEENCLFKLLNRIESDDLEILWISWKRVDEKGSELPQFKDARRSDKMDVMTGVQFMEDVLMFCTFGCTFIFKKESIRNLFFKEGIIFEDAEFIPRALIHMQRVAYSNQIAYNYLFRQDSLTNAHSPKKITDLSSVILTNFLLSKKYPNILYLKSIVGALIITAIRILADKAYKKERKAFLLFLRENNIMKITYNEGGVRKIMARIFNISPILSIKATSLIIHCRKRTIKMLETRKTKHVVKEKKLKRAKTIHS